MSPIHLTCSSYANGPRRYDHKATTVVGGAGVCLGYPAEIRTSGFTGGGVNVMGRMGVMELRIAHHSSSTPASLFGESTE